jgi:excisionase family DNA binding protein
MSSELLTVEEVAERFRVNPQTVRRWIRRGLLPAAKVGGKEWRLRAEDVEAQLRTPDSAQLRRRTGAVERLLALREQLAGRGIRVEELVSASREELERRHAAGGS